MKLATLFQDGAVLQRHSFIPVWGHANDNALIKATINSTAVYTRASKAGDFMLRLPPMEAGGPYELIVSDVDGGEEIRLLDIMIGEVWLASGQSNMEHTLFADDARKGQYEEFVSLTKDNSGLIRAISLPRTTTGVRESSFVGTWSHMDSENAKSVSAVALWHAYYLQKKLGVAIGIIVSSYGGTLVEAWTSREALLRNPDTAPLVANNDLFFSRNKEMWTTGVYDKFSKIATPDVGNDGVKRGWANPGFDDTSWDKMNVPGSWVEQKIAGNGSVWIRKRVDLPSSWVGQELILELGGVDKHDITYFNGEEIGRTGSGFETDVYNTTRLYRIKPELVKKGENCIAVRGFSFIYDGSFCTETGKCLIKCTSLNEEIDLCGKWSVAAEIDRGEVPVRHYGIAPGPGEPGSPGILFDSMIAPLIPYAIKGVIWYQGESNAKHILSGEQYRKKIVNMVDDWRYRWGQGDFPFIQVELALYTKKTSYGGNDFWPLIREAQNEACKVAKNIFVASAIDVGEANNIHPIDKKTVGYRLALVSLLEVYHHSDTKAYGPVIAETEYAGNGYLRLRFKNGEGLHFANGKPEGFFIADMRQEFIEATSVLIDGTTLLVKADLIDDPVAVRYGWANNPSLSLYNGANLPASPFRTDKVTITQ